MKFRATFQNNKALSNVCETLKGVNKRAVLKLSQDRLRVIVVTSMSEGSMQVWASLKTATIFNLFRIESKLGNDIYCDVCIRDLLTAVKSEPSGAAITVKLSKVAERPVLTIASPLRMGSGDVTHCVPVRVLDDTEIANLAVPCLTECVLAFVAPPLDALSGLFERVKGLGCSVVTLAATPTASGVTLVVTARSSHVVVAATYGCLGYAPHPNPTRTTAAEEATAPVDRLAVTASFDVKRLTAALAVKDSQPHPTLTHIHCTPESGIVLFVQCGKDVNYLYYIPQIVE